MVSIRSRAKHTCSGPAAWPCLPGEDGSSRPVAPRPTNSTRATGSATGKLATGSPRLQGWRVRRGWQKAAGNGFARATAQEPRGELRFALPSTTQKISFVRYLTRIRSPGIILTDSPSLKIKNPNTGKEFILFYSENDFIIPHGIEGMRAWDFITAHALYKSAKTFTGSDMFVDVGANIGTTSIIASEVFGTIICFEPIEENLALLQKNGQANSVDLFIFDRAVSNISNSIIHLTGDLNGNSGVSSVSNKPVNNNSKAIATTIRVDDGLCGSHPAFIHIDTEGYDLHCLDSCLGLVSNQVGESQSRPFFQIEFSPEAFMKYNSNLSSLWNFLASYSYGPYIITNNHLAPISLIALRDISEDWIRAGGMCWIDILLLPTEFSPSQFYNAR